MKMFCAALLLWCISLHAATIDVPKFQDSAHTVIKSATPTEVATFIGSSGTNISALNASSLSTGSVPTARLGSGTANSSTFLRGDSTWQAVSADAGALTGSTLASGITISSLTSFGNSPTFVTPLLGTPTSGILTNCTFPTLNQNTTGSAATLTTPRAINGVNFDGSAPITVTAAAGTLSGGTLAGGVTSSSLTSFGTSPTFVTPILGTPTSGTLTNCTFPTLNQDTTGSAAKWTTARNLAGNSVDGSADATFANKFIVQGTTDTGLSAAQFLGALSTGIVKNTTTTGVLSIAAAGTDYVSPGGALGTPSSGTLTNCTFPTLNQNTTGSAATLTTPRAINGVNFDGSAPITVTAAAGTLTGTTLNSTVVTSSLTSVGTLGNLTVTNPISGTTTGAIVKSNTPLTTKGDLWVTDGTSMHRLAVGSNTQVLTADSTATDGVKWAAGGGGGGGGLVTGTVNAPDAFADNIISPTVGTQKSLVIQAAVDSTNNLFEFQDSAGGVSAYFAADATFHGGTIIATTLVGDGSMISNIPASFGTHSITTTGTANRIGTAAFDDVSYDTHITSSAGGQIPLRVQGQASGQTADIFQVGQDGNGSYLRMDSNFKFWHGDAGQFSIDNPGNVVENTFTVTGVPNRVGIAPFNDGSADTIFTPSGAAQKAIVIQPYSGQYVSLFEIQDNSGSPRAYFDAYYHLHIYPDSSGGNAQNYFIIRNISNSTDQINLGVDGSYGGGWADFYTEAGQDAVEIQANTGVGGKIRVGAAAGLDAGFPYPPIILDGSTCQAKASMFNRIASHVMLKGKRSMWKKI